MIWGRVEEHYHCLATLKNDITTFSEQNVEVLEAKYVLKHATIATCSKDYFARIGHCGIFMLSRSPKISGFDVGC